MPAGIDDGARNGTALVAVPVRLVLAARLGQFDTDFPFEIADCHADWCPFAIPQPEPQGAPLPSVLKRAMLER